MVLWLTLWTIAQILLSLGLVMIGIAHLGVTASRSILTSALTGANTPKWTTVLHTIGFTVATLGALLSSIAFTIYRFG